MSDVAVPVLSTTDLERTIGFYRALGYTATHEQTSPYVYGAVAFNGCEIHFAATAKNTEQQSDQQGNCLVMVDDIADRHRVFTAGLRTYYGKVPANGPGRITRLRPGQSRFTAIDPDNNCVVFIQNDEPEEVEYGGSADLAGLPKVLDNARILRDFKGDDKSATRALEAGLHRFGAEATPIQRGRALAALIELAVATGDSDAEAARRADLENLKLTDTERKELAGDLAVADDLAEWLSTEVEQS